MRASGAQARQTSAITPIASSAAPSPAQPATSMPRAKVSLYTVVSRSARPIGTVPPSSSVTAASFVVASTASVAAATARQRRMASRRSASTGTPVANPHRGGERRGGAVERRAQRLQAAGAQRPADRGVAVGAGGGGRRLDAPTTLRLEAHCGIREGRPGGVGRVHAHVDAGARGGGGVERRREGQRRRTGRAGGGGWRQRRVGDGGGRLRV